MCVEFVCPLCACADYHPVSISILQWTGILFKMLHNVMIPGICVFST